MPLHHDPDTTLESRLTGSPSAYSSAGEELDNARQAEAAWRAAQKARFMGRLNRLQRLQRWTGPLEIGLGALAIVCFLIGFTLLGNSKTPSPEDLAWGDPYLDIGVYSFLAFLVLAVVALSLGGLSRWSQRLIRSQAASEGVELED